MEGDKSKKIVTDYRRDGNDNGNQQRGSSHDYRGFTRMPGTENPVLTRMNEIAEMVVKPVKIDLLGLTPEEQRKVAELSIDFSRLTPKHKEIAAEQSVDLDKFTREKIESLYENEQFKSLYGNKQEIGRIQRIHVHSYLRAEKYEDLKNKLLALMPVRMGGRPMQTNGDEFLVAWIHAALDENNPAKQQMQKIIKIVRGQQFANPIYTID